MACTHFWGVRRSRGGCVYAQDMLLETGVAELPTAFPADLMNGFLACQKIWWLVWCLCAQSSPDDPRPGGAGQFFDGGAGCSNGTVRPAQWSVEANIVLRSLHDDRVTVDGCCQSLGAFKLAPLHIYAVRP